MFRLGRKWTLLIVRDLAFLKLHRFAQFRRNNPGLSPRVLARRLREMERDGLVRREAEGRTVRYHLTERGEDAAVVLLAFLRYGLRHHTGPQPPATASAPRSPESPAPGSNGRRATPTRTGDPHAPCRYRREARASGEIPGREDWGRVRVSRWCHSGRIGERF
ncbi:MAG: winged helix-turn-helix transcriptional regulator [Candidatus Lutacidiplasmatales archaeon]